VGIGQIRLAQVPDTLAVFGIGSCVVVFVYDQRGRRGGLAHPLLPGEPPRDLPAEARGKYTPSAIRALVDELRGGGRGRRDLVAKLVGGATMFQTAGDPSGGSIGRRNVEAALAALERLRVPLVAREAGGSSGRSLVADPATGSLEVWNLRSESRLL
jgi:chemotaxis protein CheD